MKRQNDNLILALAFDQRMFILSLNKQASFLRLSFPDKVRWSSVLNKAIFVSYQLLYDIARRKMCVVFVLWCEITFFTQHLCALVQEAIPQKQIGLVEHWLSQKPKQFNWTALLSLTMHILTDK